MRAPSKAFNLQSVKIRSMQRSTTSIEPNIARRAVTNVVKPMGGIDQAATQVKVLSPEMYDIIEVDVLHETEDSMKDSAMVSCPSLYRGWRPWHDLRWKLGELGRSSVFFKDMEYARTSQSRRELADDTEEVGLTDSTQSLGKPSTRGSGQQCCAKSRYCFTNTQRLD